MKVMPESTMAVAKTYLGGQVFSDYSVTVIPGDGRCLFRALAHGAHLRSGKSAPNVSLEQELADNLRQKVLDELVKQREVSEWFIEGKFEDYVKWMRLPDAWGGEPELFIASHVLKSRRVKEFGEGVAWELFNITLQLQDAHHCVYA
eukprot:c24605_g1_i1 orf=312-752(+)